MRVCMVSPHLPPEQAANALLPRQLGDELAWHGVATLLLMPFFAGGLYRSYFTLPRPTHPRALLRSGAADLPWRSRAGTR